MSFVHVSSCFLLFAAASASAGPPSIPVRLGHNVTLPCQAPRGFTITVLEWSRTDLKSDGYVFLYRNERAYEKYQNPSFRGHVVLNDPKMTDGDVSVVLKDVASSDGGTYVCRVTVSSTEQFNASISLEVSEPDLMPRLAAAGKTDKVFNDDGNQEVNVGLVVGLSAAVVVCVVVGIVAWKHRVSLKHYSEVLSVARSQLA